MIGPFEIMSAFFLDLAIGDPRWLPHPVRIIGKVISGVEGFLRFFFKTPTGERIAGILLVMAVTIPAYLIMDDIVQRIYQMSGRSAALLGTIFIVYLTATTIATRELVRSAHLVITSIKNGDLDSGRHHVSMIVGRDTRELSEKGVLKATIETLAENLSDGIIAPLFYLALGGLPLAITYKAINTLDSMVGYKNEQYLYFGWAAARLDDVANYIPARLSGFIIVLSVFAVAFVRNGMQSFSVARRSLNIMIRDGGKHTSPNSGVPEAAMAGALGIRLGGPSYYGGVLSEKPVIGDEGNDDFLSASYDAITLIKISSVIAAVFAIATSAWRSAQ